MIFKVGSCFLEDDLEEDDFFLAVSCGGKAKP